MLSVIINIFRMFLRTFDSLLYYIKTLFHLPHDFWLYCSVSSIILSIEHWLPTNRRTKQMQPYLFQMYQWALTSRLCWWMQVDSKLFPCQSNPLMIEGVFGWHSRSSEKMSRVRLWASCIHGAAHIYVHLHCYRTYQTDHNRAGAGSMWQPMANIATTGAISDVYCCWSGDFVSLFGCFLTTPEKLKSNPEEPDKN